MKMTDGLVPSSAQQHNEPDTYFAKSGAPHPEVYVPQPHRLSQSFHDILAQMGALHDKKQKDYGVIGDPFKNVRNSEDFGVAPWVGCMIRANDKMKRIQSFAQKGELANESLEDSLLDLAVYSVIALVLLEEANDDTD